MMISEEKERSTYHMKTAAKVLVVIAAIGIAGALLAHQAPKVETGGKR